MDGEFVTYSTKQYTIIGSTPQPHKPKKKAAVQPCSLVGDQSIPREHAQVGWQYAGEGEGEKERERGKKRGGGSGPVTPCVYQSSPTNELTHDHVHSQLHSGPFADVAEEEGSLANQSQVVVFNLVEEGFIASTDHNQGTSLCGT